MRGELSKLLTTTDDTPDRGGVQGE
jgi:hypothetical protein